jgi:hypothetical protein
VLRRKRDGKCRRIMASKQTESLYLKIIDNGSQVGNVGFQ